MEIQVLMVERQHELPCEHYVVSKMDILYSNANWELTSTDFHGW